MPPLPLAGIKILDCATFIAAPFSTALLAEFGAEVIKIEQPGSGDALRAFGTPTERDGDSLAWLSEARNKRSLTLDLRQDKGQAIFRRLAEQADIVAENFRPGTLERWNLGWEDLHTLNPRLILLRVSGYGQSGPYKERPGFARIAHAFGGLSYLAGLPGGPPVTPGSTSLADYISGLYGAIGILLALRHRDQSGEGQMIDVALFESIFRVLDEIAPAFAMFGTIRQAEGAGTLNACPHGHFQCGDGSWLAIACTSDKMWRRLAAVMGQPALAARYPRVQDRLKDRAAIEAAVSHWCRSAEREEILRQCIQGEVPAGPINSIADIFHDPHVQARGLLQQILVPELGPVTVPTSLPHLSRSPGEVRHLGPRLGSDTEPVLREWLGLTDEEIGDLRQKGII